MPWFHANKKEKRERLTCSLSASRYVFSSSFSHRLDQFATSAKMNSNHTHSTISMLFPLLNCVFVSKEHELAVVTHSINMKICLNLQSSRAVRKKFHYVISSFCIILMNLTHSLHFFLRFVKLQNENFISIFQHLFV